MLAFRCNRPVRSPLFGTVVVPAFLALLSAAPAGAQDQGIWQVYLNGNQVNALAARGDEVWSATSGGVVRMTPDGGFTQWNRAFQGLLSDSVVAAASDASGRMWFGTQRAGISVLDPQTERWRVFTSLTEPIPGDRIHRIRFFGPAEAETMLVATAQGYAVFVNGETRGGCLEGFDICGLNSYDVRDLMAVGDSIWIATAAGIVVKYPPRGPVAGGWRNHSFGLNNLSIDLLARADSIYAGGTGGIWAWRDPNWSPVSSDGLPGGFHLADMLASGDTLWVAVTTASNDGGVFRRVAGSWTRLGQALPTVTSITRTPAGRLHAGTADLFENADGIWSLDGAQWVRHHMPGPSTRTSSLTLSFDSQGALWLASFRPQIPPMISRFLNGQWSFFPGGTNRSNQRTVKILQLGSDLWLAHCCCGTSADDTLCATERVRELGDAFQKWPLNEAWDLDSDANGHLWIATQNDIVNKQHGIYRVNVADSTWIQATHQNTNQGLVSDQVSAIRVAGRVAWIGYKEAGLSRWDFGPDGQPLTGDDTWRSFTHGTADTTLISDVVNCIRIAPDGKIWIGTDSGLSIYDGFSFHNINGGFGQLPMPNVTSIIPTNDGGAWVATVGGGLTRMTTRQYGFNYQVYGPPNLPSPTVRDMSFGPDGRTLWLATDYGLASFLPPQTVTAVSQGPVGVYPNPFFLNCPKHTSLRLLGTGGLSSGVICDLSGRIVGRFQDRGSSDPIWDCRIGSHDGSGGGSRVAPGLYWIRAVSPTGVHSVGLSVVDATCAH